MLLLTDTRIVAAWLVVAGVLAAGPAQARTFEVNSTGDQADINLADNKCEVAANVCTLRAAIQESNDEGTADDIVFNIGGGGAQTIVLTASLPPITDRVIIDGTTQGGWAVGTLVIEVNAAGTPAGNDTLDLQTGTQVVTIRGLCINRSPGAAIRILDSSNSVIAGNFLGTNLAGTSTTGLGNAVGVNIIGNGSNSNTIGGTTAADRNIISGNTVDGIQINGGSPAANLNVVEGNYIGLDVTGTVDLGNTNQGVAIFCQQHQHQDRRHGGRRR